jgi:hypothetical protein
MMLSRRLILMIALMVFHSEFNLALASSGSSGTDQRAPEAAGRR